MSTQPIKVAQRHDARGQLQPPTEIGQRVASRGYGGNVTTWMRAGTVVGFTKAGHPKVETDPVPNLKRPARVVIDQLGCFQRIGADGCWLRS